jgi:hypothetical protein
MVECPPDRRYRDRMRCCRCGVDIPRGRDELVRLAVMVGSAPGPIRWDRSGPWPSVAVCLRCARAVGDLLATAPVHLRGEDLGAGQAAEVERPKPASSPRWVQSLNGAG